MNQEHAFESVYNVEMLNSFKPELQLKDIESASKSKLIDLLSKLRGFKFVITLVLVYKKLENEAKTKYDNFYSSSKTEKIPMKMTVMMCFSQSILYLYETYKNL